MSAVKPTAGAVSSAPAHITELIRILGEPVLLLPCYHREKKPAISEWSKLTEDNMRNPAYLRRLYKAGNVGVATGATSGGLVSIDIDDDDAAKAFLELNPALVDCFRTKGKRGLNIHLRMLGEYPGPAFLKINGRPWGEFRSHGMQTIVYGTHPEGVRYQWLTRHPAQVVTFASIIFPDGIEGFKRTPKVYELKLDGRTEHRGTEAHEEHEEQEIVCGGVCAPLPVYTLQRVVEECLPAGPGRNHVLLHKLNRGIWTLELQEGRKYDRDMRKAVFNAWYLKALPTGYLRHGQSQEEYYFEFMSSDNVKTPLGAGVVSIAFQKAQSEAPPEEALRYETPNIRLLVCLCYQLQLIAGNQPFFLSSRDPEKLFGVRWTSCASWLKGLCKEGVLDLVDKGGRANKNNPRHATSYYYRRLRVTTADSGINTA
jgi:hypothetical protein